MYGMFSRVYRVCQRNYNTERPQNWQFSKGVFFSEGTLRYLINEYTRLTIQCFALSFDKS